MDRTKRDRLVLRNDGHRAELPKVLIEGERPGDSQPLHHDKTDAIREAPILVAILVEYLPSLPHIGFGNPFDLGHPAGKEGVTDFDARSTFPRALRRVSNSSMT